MKTRTGMTMATMAEDPLLVIGTWVGWVQDPGPDRETAWTLT